VGEEKESLSRVILPLYSERDGNVPLKSGLNQWNAGGRDRHEDEVYIQIPRWVQTRFPMFFPSRDIVFNLGLPDGRTLEAKPCQDGGELNGVKVGKALMSSPNKALGKWILRDILKLVPGEVCTLEMLQELGIDSVEVTKLSSKQYKINFAPLGAYEEFSNTYRL
ncbi:MAG: restriction endonuclease, partial [Bdellovibrionales bacterium]